MLGSIHGDTDGPKALEQWLKTLRPDVITLEFSNYGLQFRKINGDHLRERLLAAMRELGLERKDECLGPVEALFSYIDLPYEFATLSDHSQKTKTPFYLVDADSFSSLKLREVSAMMEKENVEALVGMRCNPKSGTSPERVLADLFFRGAVKVFRYTEEMHIRDNFMKDRIALLMGHHGTGRYLHVCGWQHLSDPHHVYAPLKPIKVFIHDRTVRI